jgi:hypothetical protein
MASFRTVTSSWAFPRPRLHEKQRNGCSCGTRARATRSKACHATLTPPTHASASQVSRAIVGCSRLREALLRLEALMAGPALNPASCYGQSRAGIEHKSRRRSFHCNTRGRGQRQGPHAAPSPGCGRRARSGPLALPVSARTAPARSRTFVTMPVVERVLCTPLDETPARQQPWPRRGGTLLQPAPGCPRARRTDKRGGRSCSRDTCRRVCSYRSGRSDGASPGHSACRPWFQVAPASLGTRRTCNGHRRRLSRRDTGGAWSLGPLAWPSGSGAGVRGTSRTAGRPRGRAAWRRSDIGLAPRLGPGMPA